LTSDLLSIKFKIKTTTVLLKPSFRTTHSAYLAVDFVLSVNFARRPAMHIGWKEVRLKLVNCNNSPAKFSEKWRSSRSEIQTWRHSIPESLRQK
jgi:hypothetical protein